LARCDEPNPFILLDRQDWQIELCHSCHMPSFDARWCALWWLSCVFILFLFIWVSLWRTTIYFSHFLSCWISFGPQNSFCLEKKMEWNWLMLWNCFTALVMKYIWS
jgi:hypothetical protein